VVIGSSAVDCWRARFSGPPARRAANRDRRWPPEPAPARSTGPRPAARPFRRT